MTTWPLCSSMQGTTPRQSILKGCAGAPIRLSHSIVNEGRAIVTLDLDFADIRALPPATTPGITMLLVHTVLRVHDQSRPAVLRVMAHVIDLLKSEPVAGRLWIVTDAGVRIRGG